MLLNIDNPRIINKFEENFYQLINKNYYLKKQIKLSQNQPGMICPVVTYAPTAATKPSIAAQPLKRSASGVMIKNVIYVNDCNRKYEAL